MWGPTKPTTTLDLYRLEEPVWSEECWNGDQGCAYPASEIRIAVNSSLLDDAPDVVEFLLAWDFDADVQVLSEIWMADNNTSPDEAAIWYLETYGEVWSAFVSDDVAEAVREALAGRELARSAPEQPIAGRGRNHTDRGQWRPPGAEVGNQRWMDQHRRSHRERRQQAHRRQERHQPQRPGCPALPFWPFCNRGYPNHATQPT